MQLSLTKHLISILVIIAFLLYLLNTNIFERLFFFNELFSMAGILIFFSCYFKYPKVIIPKSKIFISVIVLIIFGILYLILSFPFKTNFYFYLRNSVIIYSIFSFFLGYKITPYILKFVLKIRRLILLTVGSSILFGFKNILYYHSGSMLLPFSFKRITFFTMLLIFILSIIYSLEFGQQTAIMISLGFWVLLYVRKFWIYKYGLIVGFSMFVLLLLYFSPALKHYKDEPYRLYGNVDAVIAENPILGLDVNTTFRLVLYYRLLIEDFPQNIIGLGLGTPLMAYQEGKDTSRGRGDDRHDAHVSGAHNSYITVFRRMGILFMIPLIYLLMVVLKDYLRNFKYYNDQGSIVYYWSFFSLCIFGFLNLMLETPTFASGFWMLLGIITFIREMRIREDLNLEQNKNSNQLQ